MAGVPGGYEMHGMDRLTPLIDGWIISVVVRATTSSHAFRNGAWNGPGYGWDANLR
jgi:hypothetical protein